MPAGRPQLDDKLHSLKGTKSHPNQRGEHDRDASVSAGRPRCPQHVKEDPIALAAFKDAVRILKKRRTVSAGDAPTLAVYAVVYSTWVTAIKDVNERGFEVEITKTNKQGDEYTVMVPNVSTRIKTDCERQLLQLNKALGLTPDTREKIKQTRAGENEQKFVARPGSMAARFPERFDSRGRMKVVAKSPMPEGVN